jgi:hypothetical protein
VYAKQISAGLAPRLGIGIALPTSLSTISGWWPDAVPRLSSAYGRVANTIIILAMFSIWLEHNLMVFYAKLTPASLVLDMTREEWEL